MKLINLLRSYTKENIQRRPLNMNFHNEECDCRHQSGVELVSRITQIHNQA